MSSISGNYDYSTSYTSMLYSSQNSKYRGGVVGWQHKDSSFYTSNSYSSSRLSDKSSAYVKSVKESGTKINDALNALNGAGDNAVFSMLKATSSSDAVSVKISDQKKASAFNTAGGEKKLEVNQLASAQKNSGKMLTSSAINSLGSGNNSFAISKGGKDYAFSVSVNATDSNRTVQEKMAAAINRQNAGVTANVVYNENDKTSSLVLTSNETGSEQDFEIKDVGSGGLVKEMGAGYVATEAKDALYTLDGVDMKAYKNEVSLGDGITATFNKVTDDDEEVTVKAGKDTEEITNAIYDLVNGFNQLRETAADNSGDDGAYALQNRLDSLTGAYGATLKRAGVSLNSEGYLQIDKEKMTKAIDNGQAESVFGKDSGFTRGLSTIAKQAESDPTRYLSAEARSGNDPGETSASKLNFDDIYSSTDFSAYQTNQIMRWENVGMLLNAMV